MGSGPRPVPPEEIARRKEYVLPLYAYLRERGYVARQVAERARQRAIAAGELVPRTYETWLWRQDKMRQGTSRIPPWFIEACCAAMDKSVVEVMGAQWVARFGVDGRGGSEPSPTMEPRRQRPWSRSRTRSNEQTDQLDQVDQADQTGCDGFDEAGSEEKREEKRQEKKHDAA